MSPTSYQAAPPRSMTIADDLCEVKLASKASGRNPEESDQFLFAPKLKLYCCVRRHGPYVQVMTSCVAVCPPVPAVKPTKAVVPPTVAGISIVQEVVNVALVTVSVMVIVSVVPL